MMPTARCFIGDCQWSLWREGYADAVKLRERHELIRHPDVYGVGTNQPFEHVDQLPTVDWQRQALRVIAALPARRRFTLYEVCGHLGEPPNSNGWQNLPTAAKHLGLIVKVGGGESKRPGTRQSMTGLWERTEVAFEGRRTA